MKKQIRIPVLLMTMILLLLVMTFPVSANGPMPTPWYEIYLSNLPENTAYVDLLIPLKENDPLYVELERRNLPDGFSEQAEIITYCDDGFRSYTFHYQGAQSAIETGENQYVSFGSTWEDVYGGGNYRYSHLEDIELRGVIRLAMLDSQGNIIQVSQDLAVKPKDTYHYLAGYCYYDAATGDWEMDMAFSGFGLVGYIVLSICGVIATCLIECLAALPFKLWKRYKWTILLTNLISQIAMRGVFAVIYGLGYWAYITVLIVLEIVVYAGEFLIYHFKMKDVSWKKKLLYTITANTASLILCYYLNQMLLFGTY